ncbi:MAG TPA: MraY family glycosyltransferase, partial [Actinomycetota bacterium]|nr:MraY family glycosyltransferase [Actinomycetota bacterium]
PALPAEEVPLRLPLSALGGGFAAAAVAGLVVRPVARRLGLVARPRLWRAGAAAVPLMGGVAILAGLGAGVLAGGGLAVGPAGAVAAVGVVVLAVVGFLDDLTGLGPWTRLAWSAAAGAAAWLLGLRAVVLVGDGALDDIVNLAVTALWFVGVTHAINMLDNMDGSASGVAAVSAATIAVVAVLSGQWVVAVSASALTGGCLGYLVHNVHPARVYMGDLGALSLGFALAALGLALRPGQTPPASFFVAVFALGVPIFDTALVSVSRLRDGRPVALGGTDHAAHRLRARGLGVTASAASLWGAQAMLGLAAVGVAVSGRGGAWVIIAAVALGGAAALAWFLRQPTWRAEGSQDASAALLPPVDAAVDSLRSLLDSAALWESDPAAARLAEETMHRLARTRDALRDET